MPKISINKIMTEVHKGLAAKADKAVDGFGLSTNQQIKKFKEFIGELNDHFLFEELSIFGYCDLGDQKIKNIVRQLREEHAAMRRMADEIVVNLKNEKHSDLSSFLSILAKHQSYENRTLYPRLDIDLTNDQKIEILESVKQKK